MIVEVPERSLPPPNPNNSLLTLPRFSSISMILWEPFLEFWESWRFLCVDTCVLRMQGIGRRGGCFWSVYNFVMRIQDNWEIVGEDLKTVIREVKNHQRNLLYVMALCSVTTSYWFYHTVTCKSDGSGSREKRIFHFQVRNGYYLLYRHIFSSGPMVNFYLNNDFLWHDFYGSFTKEEYVLGSLSVVTNSP